MYTYNLFCYGHVMANNPELNEELHENDVQFKTTINGKTYEIDFPYHGGQTAGDIASCVFGTVIHDDYHKNANFVKLIKNAKESDYKDNYNQFLKQLFEYLTSGEYISEKSIKELKHFLDKNQPEFYLLEVSS